MRLYRHLLLLIVVAMSLCIAQTTIAVIDFDARNISAGEVATLTDRFRDELTKTNQYIVVERGKMEEVLREQGFQQSGCTSDECVVEVGQLIGVQQMVGGSIGKVGEVYSVSVRIIDVESGEIIHVTNYDHLSDIGGLLTVGMRNAAQQLIEVKSDNPNQVKEVVVKAKESTSPPASKQVGTVTDIDGNTYPIIKIGNQLWMAENLKVTHYRNGDPIPTGYDASTWDTLNTGAYAIYNDDANNTDIYGQSYNWYAVDDSRNIAPEGWHIPTDNEWRQLEMYLGMSLSNADSVGWRGTNEGGKLKEAGNTHWNSRNTGATNESGFTGLPGGYRNESGDFGGLGTYAYFWSSTVGKRRGVLDRFWFSIMNKSSGAWGRKLYYDRSGVYKGEYQQRGGFSIRCVKD